MQGDPVSLAIEDQGAKSVRADRVLVLKDFAPVRLDRGHGFIEPPLGVEIDEKALA